MNVLTVWAVAEDVSMETPLLIRILGRTSNEKLGNNLGGIHMRYRNSYWIAFVALLFTSTLVAQEFTGRVTDNSGAVLARKAKITIHNQLTNVDISTITTSSGDYTVPYLKPGLYSVIATANGFDKQSKTDITLEVGQTATINFVMTVGSVTETVTVTDDALLDQGKADIGEVVENTRVSELPLNGRDPSTLAQLSAGVDWFGGKQWTRPFDQTESALEINGGGSGNTVLMLDGVSNEAGSGNAQVAYIPPVDAVQEFKIITNPYDAQYGRGQGGVIDMTLKSGTNKLHGDVYEYARRTWLDANTWQNAYAGLSRPAHSQDQYGAELDGPIFIPKIFNGRDKAFFLLQFENWHEMEPNTVTTAVPMAGWINGDFSNLTYFDGATQSQQPLKIYDPLSIHQDSTGLWVRDQFQDGGVLNKIPQSRLNPIAQKILSYYPTPNASPRAGLNPYTDNFTIPDSSLTIYRNVVGKVDYNLTNKDRFTARFGYWESRGSQNANGMPGPIAQKAPNGTRNEVYAVELVHTFSPNFVADFKAMTNIYTQINLGGVVGFDQTTLGLPSSLVSQYNGFSNYFPSIGLSEFQNIGNSGGNISPDNSYNFDPSITWIKGHHTIHAGLDWRILQKTNREVGGGLNFSTGRNWTQANWQQGDSGTGNSIASFLLGVPDSGSVNINTPVFWSQHYYALFAQDDWKVTPKLTLNLGIRYDLNGPQSERHNRANWAFDTTDVNPVNSQVNQALMPAGTVLKGGMTFLGVNGAPRTLYEITKTNIQPRIGFAYSLNDKTVVRGGYGMMYKNPIPGGNQDGWAISTPFVSSSDSQMHVNTAVSLGNPFPGGILQPPGASQGLLTGMGQGLWFIQSHYKTPRYQNWSFGLERQFLKHDTIDLSYSGSRSTLQETSDNLNHVSTAAMETCDFEYGGAPENCSSAPGAYVANPFYNVPAFSGTNDYSAQTISFSTFTRPFPEFGDITEYSINGGKSWYHSMQLTAMHKWSDSLTLHGTWTWSKTMDSGGFADGNYRIPSRTLDGNDVPDRVTISGVYLLPVGHQRALLSNSNRIVDAIVGGWELGSLYVFEIGHPWTFGGMEYPHNAHVKRQSDPSIPGGAIRGVSPCAEEWVEQSVGNWTLKPYAESSNCTTFDFISVPPYGAQPNIVYSGIRIPNYHDIDTNLSKNFKLYERLTAQLRLECFNVANHPVFQNGYDGSPSDPQFGTILKENGQSNVPRETQLSLKIVW